MNTFKMKKLLFITALCLTALTTKAQFYGFESQPVCWDSSGVNVQLFAVHIYIVGNTEGTFLGYMNKTGVKRTPSVADLTEGMCNINSLLTKQDTSLSITCVELTRQMTNTADGSILYPRHRIEKHTYSVGTSVVDVKYYVPATDSLVTSPVIGISIMPCDDYLVDDYSVMLYEGDTVLISSGDTLTIDPGSGNFSTFSIICDPDNMYAVKLIIDYLPINIEGTPYDVAGSKTSFLTTYSYGYEQSWQYQEIELVRLVAVGADCRCNWVATREKRNF